MAEQPAEQASDEAAAKPFNNQHLLPRLPIPTLEETAERYL